jgi:hypothetical protein
LHRLWRCSIRGGLLSALQVVLAPGTTRITNTRVYVAITLPYPIRLCRYTMESRVDCCGYQVMMMSFIVVIIIIIITIMVHEGIINNARVYVAITLPYPIRLCRYTMESRVDCCGYQVR